MLRHLALCIGAVTAALAMAAPARSAAGPLDTPPALGSPAAPVAEPAVDTPAGILAAMTARLTADPEPISDARATNPRHDPAFPAAFVFTSHSAMFLVLEIDPGASRPPAATDG